MDGFVALVVGCSGFSLNKSDREQQQEIKTAHTVTSLFGLMFALDRKREREGDKGCLSLGGKLPEVPGKIQTLTSLSKVSSLLLAMSFAG